MEGVERHEPAEVALKEWLHKRNCSVSPSQLLRFYLSLVLVSLTIAAFFAVRGAWLVLPFAGLELLGLGVALLIYARHAVDYEYIRLSPNRLVVERMSADRLSHFEFNPRWVRIEPESSPGAGAALSYAGRTFEVGLHLPLETRACFAGELREWLGRCG
ncbi:DUF2244 domain-containing protein [Chitinasiproducens palmae]|uniref:Uncharacterized membrane protein n=1 Tax=Chitinasiproducens palmae TaxID=1770053 RepID=A0A1H2PNI2_9BURK|nr:DUF2244 domain-containing protein [Chitinasiproducens palmae]SDV48243.1 Uncharacterized membrane protein [Chitinasiproducens palmae]